MIKLQPVLKDYIWGGYRLKEMFGRENGGKKISESWEVSVHPDGLSRIVPASGAEGAEIAATLAEYLENNPSSIDKKGNPFPVLIKYIDAAQNLSVQVHPDDAYARRVERDNGKTEMWYILRADEGAGIYCGFKRDVDKEEFLKRVSDGTVEELLNFIPVKAGDCYLIKAGTVHAIGAGCMICEVQQSSNVTYRVYDYNRRDKDGNLRPLHVDKAVEVINFHAFKDETNSGEVVPVKGGKIRLLTKCKYFRCRELQLKGEFTEENGNSFTAINVLEGSGKIDGQPFSKGDSFFIPRGEKFSLSGSGKFILTDENSENNEKNEPRKGGKYYAGIDLGGTFIKCGILDEFGNIIVKDKIPTGKERPYREIAQDMADLVTRIANVAHIGLFEVKAIGIGAPGTIDSKNGVIVYSNNIAWKNIPLCAAISEISGIPVYITNDANAAALGENFCGAGKNYNSLVFITLGTGVGGGIVLDGKLYEGGYSAGAEIGHMVIQSDGEKCTCGRRGCFEAYASATALSREAGKAMEKDKDSLLWPLCDGKTENAEGKVIFEAAAKGDKTAKKVLKKYITYLAEGVANLANIFRPDVILLGGGVSMAGDALLKPLKKEVNKRLYGGTAYAPVELGIASLGNDAGLCGAAKLAMDKATESL